MVSTDQLVVMGVSGSGKTTVGKAIATALGWAFAEGDEFHSQANVAKMASGIALTDEDRWPWLQAIADWLDARSAAGDGAVVTCSALRRTYRDLLRRGRPSLRFCHVTADPALIENRLRDRTGHYMPTSLLPSQLVALEPLQEDEPASLCREPVAPTRCSGGCWMHWLSTPAAERTPDPHSGSAGRKLPVGILRLQQRPMRLPGVQMPARSVRSARRAGRRPAGSPTGRPRPAPAAGSGRRPGPRPGRRAPPSRRPGGPGSPGSRRTSAGSRT